MTVTRAQVVACARSWIGTRWHHQGAVKGVGCDCAGLLMGVAREVGLADVLITGYARTPSGHELERHCDAHMNRKPIDALLPGDVAVFRYREEPQHLAIIADYVHGGLSIVHAFAPSRQVLETILAEPWLSRLVIGYCIPGVIDG
jgi:NlpC/P60 family putative phage cell wall peptidase